jgi:signal transduction histidine kinase
MFDNQNKVEADSFYQENLQENISLNEKLARQELLEIKKTFESTNPSSFLQIKVQAKFPYFIFKDDKLFYWSDHRFVPELKNVKYLPRITFANYYNNQGLILKENFKNNGHDISIVNIINLYTSFKNQNDYLQSGYNEEIFKLPPNSIFQNPQKGALEIKDSQGKGLFYTFPPEKDLGYNSKLPSKTLYFFAAALLFFTLYIFIVVRHFNHKHKFGLGILIFLIGGIISRFSMLFLGLPFNIFDKEYINPVFYEGNFFSPTFGDSILNGLFILIFLIYVALYFFRSIVFSEISRSRPFVKSIISVILVVSVIMLGHFIGQKIENIYEDTLFNLGYSLNLSFSKYRLASFVYYFFLLGNFFLFSHIATNIFLKIHPKKQIGFFHWLYGFLLTLLILFFLDELDLNLFITGIYFWCIYYYNLSRFFYSLRFQTLMYFILAAFCFAIVAVNAVNKQENKKNLLDKRNFGIKYLADNDLLGEGLLDRLNEIIKNDSNVVASFSRSTLAAESIKQQIKDTKLDMYFDKYDVEILVFDSFGNQLGNDTNVQNVEELKNKYGNEAYSTSIKNLFFVNGSQNNFLKQYILFSDVKKSNQMVGTIVLDLKLKDENTNSVYPELLLDKKYVQNPESKSYSYGIFDEKNQLIYTSGSYNYMVNFPKENLTKADLFEKEIVINGYGHYAVKGNNSRTIVVSHSENFWKKILSEFSFLFLISILGISILLSLFAFLNGLKRFSMNFSTKIQLYLNAAFLLPLIILIFLTLSVVRSTLISIQEKSFLDNTKNIAGTIQIHLENYLSGKSSKPFFESEITDLARNTKLDINLFGLDGKLSYTTRPLIYQYYLLSEYLNPEAYNKILEQKANETIASEYLGTLNYKTVYIALKGNGTEQYGVVGIPYFDAKTLLDVQVKEVVATILIIFLAMFLLLLVLSYFASAHLTSPLKIIAQRLKKTNLDKLDETIEWKSNDEIGLLTRSYNKMIKKLDESKNALSQSEKQTAWREMAKQVAHEIKNPLTPMKLSIQQLQRTLPLDDPKSRERIQRALNSLNEQIDNISEIANSFSEFAKMPVPRNERFDLVSVAQKTTDLYSQNHNISIDFQTSDKEIYVLGDRLLVSRAITNLILNGLQSVPPIRQPKIEVKVYKNIEENFGMIEVKDNGIGIDEEIRKKVFIPNFSTKVGGSGLGLAMAKRGIEHAGGNIWFETVENEGTTFFVDLPMT